MEISPTSKSTAGRILVIDDEPQIRRLLHLTLETARFTVYEAPDGQQGQTEAAYRQPDAIILDLGLPDLPGIEVLRRLRDWYRGPVIILSVRDREDDKVAALDWGADDYLTKPFGASELLARLRAVLRRTQPGADLPIVCFGDIEVDFIRRQVRRAGQEVRLTGKEYAFLRLLVAHRGKVLTHRHLLRELWGPQAEEQTHYLRVHMAHLRQKLEDDPAEPVFLRTEAGIGYRLCTE